MVAIESRASLAAMGRIDLGIGHGPWLFGMRGALESTTDLDPSSSSILVRYAPVGIYAGRTVAHRGRFILAPLAGLGLQIVSARASGFSSDRAFTMMDPIAFGGLWGEWRFGRHLGLVGAGDVVLTLRRDQFSVANLGPVAQTPRARAGFSLGVAWHPR
jgi:hypothetical protein